MAEAIACDYLVVGAGATGMAFADSLLKHHAETGGASSAPVVVMVDRHDSPGGQWHDSYEFVRLHQPSAMYGVESEPLEEGESAEARATHRATRAEILKYYSKVADKLAKLYGFRFLGGMEFVFEDQPAQGELKYQLRAVGGGESKTVQVRKKLVDARFLEPDLPIHVAPKFTFDKEKVNVVPVNELSGMGAGEASSKHFVVIGGGKTGMDAVVYLQSELKVPADKIMWVTPNQVWITARENIGSCMELLHESCAIAKRKVSAEGASLGDVVGSAEVVQEAFEAWEQQGRVYRFSQAERPPKFKDATLERGELQLLRQVTRVLGKGRVRAIADDGALLLADGSAEPLPFPAASTVFVHCSAGAFNYTKQPPGGFPPIFEAARVTVQDVYGTPGFCFVGSVIGKLEALSEDAFPLAAKNALCRKPSPDPQQLAAPLGPDGGRVGGLGAESGLVQRLQNLRGWYGEAGLGGWMHAGGGRGHRLYNLGHMSQEEARALLEASAAVLVDAAVIPA